MIQVTITASKHNTVYEEPKEHTKTFYLEDEHDFKEIYDCEAVRELVEIVNK